MMTRVICADRRSVVVLHSLVCRRPESGRWSVNGFTGVVLICNNCGRRQRSGKFCLDCGGEVKKINTQKNKLSYKQVFSILNLWRRAGLVDFDHSAQVWSYDDEAVFSFAKANRRDLEYGDLCREMYDRLRPDDEDIIKKWFLQGGPE